MERTSENRKRSNETNKERGVKKNMFGLEQLITISIPTGSWFFLIGISGLGAWKAIEIAWWLYSNTGSHTPSLQ